MYPPWGTWRRHPLDLRAGQPVWRCGHPPWTIPWTFPWKIPSEQTPDISSWKFSLREFPRHCLWKIPLVKISPNKAPGIPLREFPGHSPRTSSLDNPPQMPAERHSAWAVCYRLLLIIMHHQSSYYHFRLTLYLVGLVIEWVIERNRYSYFTLNRQNCTQFHSRI